MKTSELIKWLIDMLSEEWDRNIEVWRDWTYKPIENMEDFITTN